MPTLDSLPDEILRIIAQLIYLDHLPRSLFRCIDPHGLPSTYPDGRLISSTQPLTQTTLHALCLTNSRLYHAAKPLLWRRLQIRLPYSFLLLLRSLGAAKLAEAYEKEHRLQDDTGFGDEKLNEQMSVSAMIAAVGLARVSGKSLYVTEKPEIGGNEGTEEAMDLIWVEDQQPREVQMKPRYHLTFRNDHTDMSDVHRYPRVLDFSTFTTQGMRRTIGEGQDYRFVTPAKLLALITAVSEGLMAFGASSTMDSALSLEVLEALLFRDGEMASTSAQRTLRGVSMERSVERRDRHSRRRLESLDLCNCISRSFEVALAKFVQKHLRKFSGRATSTVEEEDGEEMNSETGVDVDDEELRGRGRSRGRESNRPTTLSRSMSTRRSDSMAPSQHPARATRFPSVARLGLSGIHFSAELLNPFVMAFSRLTHLDLSGTKADETLLRALSASPDMDLESLSLARCSRITSASITELLVDSPICTNLTELSLEGSLLFPTPVFRADLETIIKMAPFMRSGSLRYLDLGGCRLDDELLKLFHKQPALLDLGLSASPDLSLDAVCRFLIKKAPNVQVLELVDSCHETSAMSVVNLNTKLLDPCTTTPPLSISEQMAALGIRRSMADQATTPVDPPRRAQAKTNLRVVGLNLSILRLIQGALGSWHVILGAGRRGWLVDVTSGPDPEAVNEDLEGSDDEQEVVSIPMKRGRQGRHGISSGSWEPETPPRRLSRSPSGPTKRPVTGSIFMSRQQSSGSSPAQSRSRSRQLRSPPVQSSLSPHHREEEERGEETSLQPRAEVIRGLSRDHPRRRTLEKLSSANGHVSGTTGWHSRKMEVLLGMGMLGRESGSYAYAAYQT